MKKILLSAILIYFIPVLLSGQKNLFTDVTSVSNTLINIADGVSQFIDYDSDGDLDIFICGNSGDTAAVALYRNDQNDQFTFVNTNIPPLMYADASWGDYNGDNFPDLLLIGASKDGNELIPHSYLFQNHGNDQFTNLNIDLPDVYSGSVCWGDTDNDGDSDIVITGAFAEEQGGGIIMSLSRIIRNDGNNIFTTLSAGLQGVYDGKIAFGDYDNDQDLDLLINGYYFDTLGYGNRFTGIYINEGEGEFSYRTFGLPSLRFGDVAWGDKDNDNDLDIILNGDPSTPTFLAYIFNNNDNGTFSDIGIEILGTIDGNVCWADYNNDGNVDFIQSGYLEISAPEVTTRLYRNYGSDLFNVDPSASLRGLHKSSISWGDYDNDGDVDLLMSGYTDIQMENSGTFLFKNNTETQNTAPIPPNNLTTEINRNQATLGWSNAYDSEQSGNGFSYNIKIGTTSGGTNICPPMATNDGCRQIAALGNANTNIRWIIENLADGIYFWSVQAIDQGFAVSSFSEESSFEINTVGIDQIEISEPGIKTNFYPNPFTDNISIELDLLFEQFITVSLLNDQGKFVSMLINKCLSRGKHQFGWDRSDFPLNELKKGIYILNISGDMSNYFLKLVAL